MKKILAFFVLVAFNQVNAQFCFNQTGNIGVPPSNTTFALCAADFNHDNYIDVAATGTTNTIALLPGQGNGSFSTGPIFGVQNDPEGIVSGDFNKDGNPDLAVTNYNSAAITILLGNGSMGFYSNVTMGAPSQPKAIKTADFNGDGNLDLVFVCTGPNAICIFYGSPSGSFSGGPMFNVNNGAPMDLCILDFNGDGKKDVITINNASNNCSYLAGNGTGGFSSAVTLVGGFSSPYGICTNDFNNDGHADFAVSNGTANQAIVFMCNGTGGILGSIVTPPFGSNLRGIESADFNGDNLPDLVCTGYNSNTITFIAAPGFNAMTTYNTGGAGGARNVTVADFNNDGKKDVAVANNASGSMTPFMNNFPYPITAVSSPTVICSGNSASLSASGNIQVGGNSTLTYAWTPSSSLSASTGTSVIATPSVTTSYTVTSSYSGCGASASTVVTVSVNPTPTVTVNSMPICSGSSGLLTAHGASTYTWTPNFGLSATTGSVVAANPSSSVIYTVTGTSSAGCSSAATSTVIVNPLPVVTSANNKAVCSGSSINLALTSNISSTFTWITSNNPNTSGESISTQTTSTISDVITHTLSTPTVLIYTVTPKAVSTGCTGPAQTVTVTVNPVDAISNMTTSVCSGGTFSVTPANGINGIVASPSTYTWSAPTVTGGMTGGASGGGSSITGTLTNTTTTSQTAVYVVSPTALGTCAGSNFTVTVTVDPTPVMTSASTATICSGNNVNLNLTSGAAATYSWVATDNSNTTGESTTAQAGSVINDGLTSTSTSIQTVIYTVTPIGTAGSCIGSAQSVTVTIDNLPPAAAAGSDVSLCATSMNLAANAASPGTGTWSLVSQSAPTFTTNGLPSNNNTALVWFTGIATSNSATLRWTINSQLGVCAATFDDMIITKVSCPLTAAFVTSPTSHTLCLKPATTVTVTYTDNSSAGSNPPINSWSWTFNGGTPSTATGQGPHVVTYSYSATQQSYNTSLTVVDNVSNISTANQLITLNPYPSAAGPISGSVTVCQGQNGVSYSIPTVLNADNGYSWVFPSGVSSTNPNNIALSDFSTIAQSGVIKVCGLNACGAGDTAYLSVTVNPLPGAAGSIDGLTTVCQGETSVSYSIAPVSNATNYLWILPSGGTTSSTSNTASVNFSTSATSGMIKVVGKNACGDGDTSYLSVTVNTLPNITASATANSVCAGMAVTLNGSGANTYTWSSGVTDGASFVPGATDTYTVSGTGANSCINSATISVTVNQLPTVGANATSTVICSGGSVTLSGSGASTYTWSGGVVDGMAFTPIAAADYTVTGTDLNGCVNTSTITVGVNPLPVVTASASATTLCANSGVVLTGSGASTYTWSGGVSDGVSFNPTSSGSYTVTGQDTNSCLGTAVISINVITPAIPSICMLSVDSQSINNIIYWDKTLYQRADSFIIYREVSTGLYKRIGAVSNDSLSMFIDNNRAVGPANGDPNVGYFRYKLQLRDSCGNYSALSPYHTSVFFIDNHNGTFTWNSYDVEGQPTPVANYYLMRDSANINDWRVIGIVAGSTSTLNDPTYSSYQFVGNWRVDGDGFGCTPTLRTMPSSVAGAIVRSKSNISNNRTSGTKSTIGVNTMLTVYPNPGNGNFTIASDRELGPVVVYNSLGEIVYQSNHQHNTLTIDLAKQTPGVYILQAQGKHLRLIKE